jgi:hypothetical protein
MCLAVAQPPIKNKLNIHIFSKVPLTFAAHRFHGDCYPDRRFFFLLFFPELFFTRQNKYRTF